jgi:hypothetical protein
MLKVLAKNGMLKVLLITNLVIYSSIYVTKIFPRKMSKMVQ